MRCTPFAADGTRLASGALGVLAIATLASCTKSPSSPTGVVASPASSQLVGQRATDETAWVTNSGQIDGVGSVSLISTETMNVLATLPLDGAPEAVTFTPNDGFAYASQLNFNQVSVFDSKAGHMQATVPVTIAPINIAFTPDGKSGYVTGLGSSVVSVIDPQSNAVVATANIPGGSNGIAITPDGRFAYVTDWSDNNVSVIDTRTNTVVAQILVAGGFPTGIAVTPDGKSVFVEDFSDISVIETSSNTIATTIPVAGICGPIVTMSPDGKRTYAADYCNNRVLVIDTHGRSLVTSITTSTPIGLAPTKDGASLYVVNNNCPAFPCTELGTVSVVATATNQVVNTVTIGINPQAVAITNRHNDELVDAGEGFRPPGPHSGERANLVQQAFAASRNGCVRCRRP